MTRGGQRAARVGCGGGLKRASRLALAGGFLFFLVKGMLWLSVPVLIARGCLVGS